eukprot:jgi/Mesen1/752/ME000110S_11020
MVSVEIELDKNDRVYYPGEEVKGVVKLNAPASLQHGGIKVTASGTVTLQARANAVGVLDSLYGSARTITLLDKAMELSPPAKLPQGSTQVGFEFVVEPCSKKGAGRLLETYRGVCVTIQYVVSVHIPRGVLHKPLTAAVEFIVESSRG